MRLFTAQPVCNINSLYLHKVEQTMNWMEHPSCERMEPTIKLCSYIIEWWNMSQGWVNSPMMFWRDNKARLESTHFALDSWGLLLIGQGKYFAFSGEQPRPVVHIKPNWCLSALCYVRVEKSARAGEGVNRDTPSRLRAGQRQHPPIRSRTHTLRPTHTLSHTLTHVQNPTGVFIHFYDAF